MKMATSSKKKAVVNKDDLRRLMREKKAGTKTVDSPLAKYNNLGQLSCVLCNQPIKNELLWSAHIQGRTHKENVTRLKAEKVKREEASVQPPEPSIGKKRKHVESDNGFNAKAQKGSSGQKNSSLPADFFDSSVKSSKPKVSSSQPKGILKNAKPTSSSGSLGLGGYDSASSEEDEEESRKPAGADTTVKNDPSDLPSDFFDQGVKPSTSTEHPQVPGAMSEKLPEGFFDDPKQDAKVREVEYKDKMDEEWELFQRAMKEEAHYSEAIIEEEDQAFTAERDIEEIDEQMRHWSEINKLEKKKEEIMRRDVNKSGEEPKKEEEEEDITEEDLEDFMDWRTKKI